MKRKVENLGKKTFKNYFLSVQIMKIATNVQNNWNKVTGTIRNLTKIFRMLEKIPRFRSFFRNKADKKGNGQWSRGGFRGRGRGKRTPPSLRDSTPCRPKGSPLWYFLRNPFLAERRQYILILRGSARQKTQFFLSKFLKKCPKTAFFDCFFKNLAAAYKI